MSRHHGRDHRGCARIAYADVSVVKGILHSLFVQTVVHHAGLQHLALPQSVALGVDDEEIAQRPRHVDLVGQVGEIHTILHRFVMDLAVGPSPEQRHGGIDAVVLAVATIVDIRKHALVFGLCSRGVLAHAHADADLRAVVIAHGHLHRAVGLIAAAQLIGRGRPSGVARCRTVSHDAVALLREPFLLTVADTGTKAVGHVDKSAVGPSRAPRVGDDPRTVFIVAKMVTGLSGYAVTRPCQTVCGRHSPRSSVRGQRLRCSIAA